MHLHPGFLAVVDSEDALDDSFQFLRHLQWLSGTQSELEGSAPILLLTDLRAWPRPEQLVDLDFRLERRRDITDGAGQHYHAWRTIQVGDSKATLPSEVDNLFQVRKIRAMRFTKLNPGRAVLPHGIGLSARA